MMQKKHRVNFWADVVNFLRRENDLRTDDTKIDIMSIVR